MKKLHIIIYLLMLALLPACIEEYSVSMQDADNVAIVVEGQIIGNSECEFILQHSMISRENGNFSSPELIRLAGVSVVCSNGEVYGAERRDDSHFYVTLGELDPNQTYHLHISLPYEGVVESEPMKPLRAPALKSLSYTLTDDGENVTVRLTNEDPQSEAYYLWTYDEYWEINTPFVSEWEYEPWSNTMKKRPVRIDRGWCSLKSHPLIVGSNLDYGNGALQDYALYSLSKDDNRFNTRYYTKVHQIAISKTEYEYYKQLEVQSSQTGGIFTLMPAQLPTNLHNENGYKTIGYVGVHLNSAYADIYIDKEDVGYQLTADPELLDHEEAMRIYKSWYRVHQAGYVVYKYNQVLQEVLWTRPWCIDCRTPYWGASLKRPDFWKDRTQN